MKDDYSDLTKGSITGHFLRIGLPASLGLLFNTLYNVTDTWFAGKISTDALAGLSLSFPAFFVVLSIGLGIGTASVALISNAIGGGDIKKSVLYFTQSILATIVLSMLLLVTRKFYIAPIFTLMGASGKALELAVLYMDTIILGIPFFLLNNVLNSMLNARGNTKSYRNVLIVGFFVNIFLDPLLLYGFWIIPPMGIAGIALATVLVQVGACIYLLRELSKIIIIAPAKHCTHLKQDIQCDTAMFSDRSNNKTTGKGLFEYIKENFSEFFYPHKKILFEIISQSIPAILNMMSIALGMFVINYFLNIYAGKNSIAAYGVGLRIEQIALLPGMGITSALLAITGQNWGAGQIDRVKKAFRVSLMIGAVVLVFAVILLFLFAGILSSFFTDDKDVLAYAVFYLRLAAATYYCYILLPCANSLLQGIKKPAFIMWIGLFRQIIAPALVFYYICNIKGMEAKGIFLGIAAINWFAAIVSLLYCIYLLKKADKIKNNLLIPVPEKKN